MSRITLDGRRYTLGREEALDSLDRVVFRQPMLPHVSEQLVVNCEGSPMHQGQGRTYVADGGARQMPVARLPPDAPDRTPEEGGWHQLTKVDMRHRCGRNLTHRRRALGRALRRLRRQPRVMTACGAEAGRS